MITTLIVILVGFTLVLIAAVVNKAIEGLHFTFRGGYMGKDIEGEVSKSTSTTTTTTKTMDGVTETVATTVNEKV